MPIISEVIKIAPIGQKQKTPPGSPVLPKGGKSPQKGKRGLGSSALFPRAKSPKTSESASPAAAPVHPSMVFQLKYSSEDISQLRGTGNLADAGEFLGYVVMLIPADKATLPDLSDVKSYVSNLQAITGAQLRQKAYFESQPQQVPPGFDAPVKNQFFHFIKKDDAVDISINMLVAGNLLTPADNADKYVAISLPVFEDIVLDFKGKFTITHLQQIADCYFADLMDVQGETQLAKEPARVYESPQPQTNSQSGTPSASPLKENPRFLHLVRRRSSIQIDFSGEAAADDVSTDHLSLRKT